MRKKGEYIFFILSVDCSYWFYSAAVMKGMDGREIAEIRRDTEDKDGDDFLSYISV